MATPSFFHWYPSVPLPEAATMKTTAWFAAADWATGCATITGGLLTASIAPAETAIEEMPPRVLVMTQSWTPALAEVTPAIDSVALVEPTSIAPSLRHWYESVPLPDAATVKD